MKKKILKINPSNVDKIVSKAVIQKVSNFIGQYKKSIINLGYDQKTIQAINRTQKYFLTVDPSNPKSQKLINKKINELQFWKGIDRHYNVDSEMIEFEFKYTTKIKKREYNKFVDTGDYSKEAISSYYQKFKGDSPISLHYLLQDLDFSNFAKNLSNRKIAHYEKKIAQEKNKLLQIALNQGKKRS